jgi:hypothetical protein
MEMSTGRAALILEPVPLFDRAVSATLEYLAERKAKAGCRCAGGSCGTVLTVGGKPGYGTRLELHFCSATRSA